MLPGSPWPGSPIFFQGNRSALAFGDEWDEPEKFSKIDKNALGASTM